MKLHWTKPVLCFKLYIPFSKLLWYSDPRRVELLLRSPEVSLATLITRCGVWPSFSEEKSYRLLWDVVLGGRNQAKDLFNTIWGEGFSCDIGAICLEFDSMAVISTTVLDFDRHRITMKHLYICSQIVELQYHGHNATRRSPSQFPIIPLSVGWLMAVSTSRPIDKINFRLTANQQNQNQLNLPIVSASAKQSQKTTLRKAMSSFGLVDDTPQTHSADQHRAAAIGMWFAATICLPGLDAEATGKKSWLKLEGSLRRKEKQTKFQNLNTDTFSFARKNAYTYIFTIWHSTIKISYIYIHVIHINVMRYTGWGGGLLRRVGEVNPRARCGTSMRTEHLKPGGVVPEIDGFWMDC